MKKLLLTTLISLIALASCDSPSEPEVQQPKGQYDGKILDPANLNFDKETRIVLKDFYFVETIGTRKSHCYVYTGDTPRYAKNDTMYIVKADSIVGEWTTEKNFKLRYFRWNAASMLNSEYFTCDIKEIHFNKTR
jgi:hypothetical protein